MADKTLTILSVSILKLTGHRPSADTLLTTAIGMIISFLFVATLKLGEFIGETKYFMNNTQESFRRIKTDIDKIKENLNK